MDEPAYSMIYWSSKFVLDQETCNFSMLYLNIITTQGKRNKKTVCNLANQFI